MPTHCLMRTRLGPLHAPVRFARTTAWAAQLFAGVPRAARWSCLVLYLIVAPVWLLLLTTQDVAAGGLTAIAVSIASLACQISWVALAPRLGPVTWFGLSA